MTSEVRYDKTSCVDPMKLVREVKKHEIIYNRGHPLYKNAEEKAKSWEQVYAVVFPEYGDLDDATRAVIAKTVRKRWKSLRDSIVKEKRRKAECPEYQRIRNRTTNAFLEELKFVLPYVKKHSPLDTSDPYERTPNPIDLTSDFDDEDDSMFSSEMFYPTTHLGGSFNGSEEHSDGMDAVPPYAGYPIKPMPHDDSPPPMPQLTPNPKMPKREPEDAPVSRKRKRSSRDPYMDQVVSFMGKMETREEDANDEDRMFLLSLLSDLKQVPSQKKLRVKSEILAAISNGQSQS